MIKFEKLLQKFNKKTSRSHQISIIEMKLEFIKLAKTLKPPSIKLSSKPMTPKAKDLTPPSIKP